MSSLIILSVFLSFINAFLPFIAKWIAEAFGNYKPRNSIKNEIEVIKNRLNEISMKDEFAKYTKLQRTLNKLKEEVKAEVRTTKAFQLKVKLGIQYVSQGILTLICLTLFWTQRSTPVIIFNENWLHPFGSVLSWPTHIPGALGFPVWFLVSNTVAKMASLSFKVTL